MNFFIDAIRSDIVVLGNMELEFQRSEDRFAFLKWGYRAFQNMLVAPLVLGIRCATELESIVLISWITLNYVIVIIGLPV